MVSTAKALSLKVTYIEFLESRRVPDALWWILMLWLGVLVVFQVWQVQGKLGSNLPVIDVVQPVQPERRLAAPQPKPPPYLESAKQAWAQLEAWWVPALTAIEATSLVGLRVMSVDITSSNHQVVVTFEVPTVALALVFVDGLNTQIPAEGWHLQSLDAQTPGSNPTYRGVVHWSNGKPR